MSKIFRINLADFLRAVFLGIITAILVVLVEIKNVGSIYGLDWKTLLNDGIISLIASIASIIQSLLTTEKGNLVGAIKIK